MKITAYLLSLSLIFFSACKTGIIQTRSFTSSEITKINELKNQIKNININSPSSFSAKLHVTAGIRKKKVVVVGSATYEKKSKKMYISLLDFVFHTPIVSIFQNNDSIKFYFPMEKKLYSDNINKIDISKYTRIDIDYDIIYDLITGKIPIINNFTVTEVFTKKNGNASFFVLENSKFIETISFDRKIPEKIILIEKQSNKKFEITLKRHTAHGKSHFFRRIRITTDKPKMKLTINFKGLKLNTDVTVKTIEDAYIPKNIKIKDL